MSPCRLRPRQAARPAPEARAWPGPRQRRRADARRSLARRPPCCPSADHCDPIAIDNGARGRPSPRHPGAAAVPRQRRRAGAASRARRTARRHPLVRQVAAAGHRGSSTRIRTMPTRATARRPRVGVPAESVAAWPDERSRSQPSGPCGDPVRRARPARRIRAPVCPGAAAPWLERPDRPLRRAWPPGSSARAQSRSRA